ncbi:MAG: TetR/AcrR family transcriptional regulator [Halioglobus sp.]|nr:TetR/AcrR family transcriptional regulator [Halioglobus sp.]
MAVVKRQVELLEKNKPRQERAKRTYEAILTAAAELLVEVGVERISTNLVAERAGITVPALYRYFPNKYAVLHALGAGLMDAQNRIFQTWFERNMENGDPGELVRNVRELLSETLEVTRQQTGGIEILQALRAVAPLREVRLESHRRVAEQFANTASKLLDRPVDEVITSQARVTIEVGYAVVEMCIEDETLSTEHLLNEGARLVQYYWEGMLTAAFAG